MVVRLRLTRRPRSRARRAANRRYALAFGALLTPAALMACVLAIWRLGADMRWTGTFAISDGIFSHWQVWIVMAVALEFGSIMLTRWGKRGGGASTP